MKASDLPRSAPWTAIVLAVVWCTTGGNFIAFHAGVQTIPPFLLASARLLIATVVMLPMVVAVLRREGRAALGGRTRVTAAVVQGACLLVLGQGSVAWSVHSLGAGVTALITASMPIWATLLSRFWLREPLAPRGALGVALGFVGLVLLSQARGGDGGSLSVGPAIVTLLGAMATAVGVTLPRRVALPENPVVNTVVQLLSSGLMLVMLGVIAGEWQGFAVSQVSDSSWLALAYLVVFGSAIGLAALLWVTRNAPPTAAASFAYAGPVIALGLAAVLLGEPIGSAKALAALLATSGAVLMVGATRRPTRRHAPPSR